MKSAIPKIIHYCWFGGGKLPDSAKKCIASWKKYCPDYEIREWNESNYDVNKIPYIREAYELKRYAFVSDYARFDVLYQYGGIYFDVDVEVIKSIDEIVKKGAFMGREISNGTNLDSNVAAGLGIGATAGNMLVKEILEYYEKLHFCDSSGEVRDDITVVKIVGDILKKHGLSSKQGIEKVCGFTIYPPQYFCPMNYWTGELVISKETVTIHHYTASWLSEKQIEIDKLKRWYGRFLTYKCARFIAMYHYEIKNEGIKGVCKLTQKKLKTLSRLIFKK